MTALEQLRSLLGVEVVGVRSMVDVNGPHRWAFAFEHRCNEFPDGHEVERCLRGGDLRNPRRLNDWTRRQGRPATALPLSAQDGHRAAVLADLVMGASDG